MCKIFSSHKLNFKWYLTIYFADVTTTDRHVHHGKDTILSCKITGISVIATVSWIKGTQTLQGSTEEAPTGNTLTSTLTMNDPQEDTEYTCVVNVGHEKSETKLMLIVYSEF